MALVAAGAVLCVPPNAAIASTAPATSTDDHARNAESGLTRTYVVVPDIVHLGHRAVVKVRVRGLASIGPLDGSVRLVVVTQAHEWTYRRHNDGHVIRVRTHRLGRTGKYAATAYYTPSEGSVFTSSIDRDTGRIRP